MECTSVNLRGSTLKAKRTVMISSHLLGYLGITIGIHHHLRRRPRLGKFSSVATSPEHYSSTKTKSLNSDYSSLRHFIKQLVSKTNTSKLMPPTRRSKASRAKGGEEEEKEAPKSTPHLPRPPQIHPLPSAAAASLLLLLGSSSSATTKPYHVDYPAVSSVLLRVARARLFPLLRSLLDALRLRRGPPLRDSHFASLIQHLGRARLPDDALRLFLSIPSFPCADKSPSTHTLNSLLHALVDNARLPEARALLARSSSQQLGLRPNAVSYNAILKGCCSCASHGALARAREVLDEMARRGVRPSAATYNTLIRFAIRSKQWEAAVRLKEEMGRKGVRPNAVTYAILMQGLCSEGRFEAAKKVMFDMEYQGCAVSAVNYGVLMSDRGRRGDVAGMTELLREMRRRGMKPDAVTYSILINCMCAEGRVGDTYKVFVEMQMKGECEPSAVTYRMLVDGCCRAGEF
ncbi:Pentatricopeptide repeat-containing protein, mitochondrial [Ananas comosus]|uniref:Pentatricopeptide repeat-containing protein, mitochondrial n=1 Tax=Ananas comosus TaxID=4615 RepID=A0A199VZA6_ANACO|nr:Pentatricopeptide repeat-containing protein, mitochondrial [Ananas comosus]